MKSIVKRFLFYRHQHPRRLFSTNIATEVQTVWKNNFDKNVTTININKNYFSSISYNDERNNTYRIEAEFEEEKEKEGEEVIQEYDEDDEIFIVNSFENNFEIGEEEYDEEDEVPIPRVSDNRMSKMFYNKLFPRGFKDSHIQINTETRELIDLYLEEAPVIPATTIQRKIFACANAIHPSLAKRVLDTILETMPEVADRRYVTIMLNHLLIKTRYINRNRKYFKADREQAIEYYNYFTKKGVRIDTITCHNLIANYLDNPKTIEKALKVFETMPKLGIHYDEHVFNQIMVKLALYEQDMEVAYKYLRDMQFHGIKKGRLSYEALFVLHSRGLSTIENAELLWEEMCHEENISPRIETYNAMIACINMLAPQGEAYRYAIKYFEMLEADENIKHYTSDTWEDMLQACSKDGDLDNLLILWHEWETRRHKRVKTTPKAWNALFECLFAQDNVETLELVHTYFQKLEQAIHKGKDRMNSDGSSKISYRTFHTYFKVLYKLDKMKNNGVISDAKWKEYQALYKHFVDINYLNDSGMRYKYFYMDRHNEITYKLGLDYHMKYFTRSTNQKLNNSGKQFKRKNSTPFQYSNLTIFYQDHEQHYIPDMLSKIRTWLNDNDLHYTLYNTNEDTISHTTWAKCLPQKISVRWQDIILYQAKHLGYVHGAEFEQKKKLKQVGVLKQIYENALREQQEEEEKE